MDGKTNVAHDVEHGELISVIIPTYNRVKLLERSVQSVLSQTYTDLELLIIDDCSDDGTEEFVKKIKDERVHYYRNDHNMGPAASRNRGAMLAKGSLIAYQDSDDEWLPDKLMRLMEVWQKESDEETGMIYHEMQEQGASAVIPSRDFPLEWKTKEIFRHMLLYPMIGGTASLIRKSCLEELGGFHEALGSIEDYEFYLRLAKKYRVLFVGEPLMIIYDTPGSVNKRFKSKIDTELYILDTMYDSLCQYDILQKKVNLIRQQAENYDCEAYFYEQALRLCERIGEKACECERENENKAAEKTIDACDLEKKRRIRECIGKAAKEIGQTGNGDRAEYYTNAAGQIQRVVDGLTRLKENLKKNPGVLSKNRAAVVAALSDIIKNLGDYTDLSLHPVPQKQKLDGLWEKLEKGQKSDEIINIVLNDTLNEAGRLFSQIGKAKCYCTVCEKEVRFLPASPYKRVLREYYGFQNKGVEFLFEGEDDRCPVCKAPEDIRFLLGFLEDVQPEGGEKLKIGCMEATDTGDAGIQEWIRKYVSVKTYLEFIPAENIEEQYGNMDVLICVDLLEHAEDDSGIPERIMKLLKENGVCIVMTRALLRGASPDSSGDASVISLQENSFNTSGPEKEEIKRIQTFGLEGVRRLYSEDEIINKFEEAGFSVGIADKEWFGGDYYEQCGFGRSAKLFMLTRKEPESV